ncbi:MAG: septum formation protein Maf [Deltaproteobacteria bacterium]|nr:septum formation protein Maf [Deltaproteobacteria bacterium]
MSLENPLILASASPRRKRLLEQVGLPIRVLPSDIDENQTDFSDPEATVRLLAHQKALAVSDSAEEHWILGADTTVVLGRTKLGKPADKIEARSMLTRLSGKEHRVITGFCILFPDSSQRPHRQAVTTRVKVKDLRPAEIEAYIETGEPFGKAGSYAIQGIGAFLVESISGSYTNVVGLPVCAVIKALLALGALRCFPLPPSIEFTGLADQHE